MATVGRTRSRLNYGIISVSLDVLLEVLRPLEGLSTEFTSMWFERYVNTNVRGDVITFYDSYATVSPSACQVEVVGALAADVALADMVLFGFNQLESLNQCRWLLT